jgi:V/A-type H+-transporting ATPase subunit A
LFCAELINEAFLRQSAFSEIDRYAGPGRQAAMMRLLAFFVVRAEAALQAGVGADRIAAMTCVRPLQRMGEEIAEGELDKFTALEARMEAEFRDLCIPA